MIENSDILLEVKDLKVHFPVFKGRVFKKPAGFVRAVDGINFKICRGETLGLVGESGCGKSTTGRAITQLEKSTSGEILFEGEDLCKMPYRRLCRCRRDIQMIFQDPFASLNPRMTVEDIIAEPLTTHKIAKGRELRERVQDLLLQVGMNPKFIRRYPHEFSGGQRQRIGIARALALNPKLIIADEPISALDVSIQAQILNLMMDLQDKFNLTYLFIAHDLAAVRHISDRVAVMYLGKIVEIATYEEIYKNPKHPYTQALLSSVPIPDPDIEEKRQRVAVTGEIPSPINPPLGCRFHTRCPHVMSHCKLDEPALKDYGQDHRVSCYLMD